MRRSNFRKSKIDFRGESAGTLDAYSGMDLQNGDIASTGADSKTLINLKKGEILNEITEPLSNNSTYEVNTPKATMAVRGTSFDVKTILPTLM